MASKRTHDVSATIGEYTNGAGETKKRYITVGSAFTDESNRISIKLDAVPVNPEWSGWLSLYPVKDRDDREQDRRQPAPPKERPRNHNIPDERRAANQADDWDNSSDIPF